MARSAWISGLVKGRSSAADERGASQRESASALVMQNCCLVPLRATSLRFLEPLMISKSPLIERLNQPKAKKHSCYCDKVQVNCILFLK